MSGWNRRNAMLAALVAGLAATVGSPAPAVRAASGDTPLDMAVTSSTTSPPVYTIEVRNRSDQIVDTTVRQELPAGFQAVEIGGDGRVESPTGLPGTEVSWQLQLAGGDAATLRTTLAAPADSAVRITTPVCAYVGSGERPYACATTTWDGVRAAAAARAEGQQARAGGDVPWWQSPAVVVGGLAVLALLAGALAGLWWARIRRRRKEEQVVALARAESTTPVRTGRRRIRPPGAGAAGGPRPGWRMAPRPRPPAPKRSRPRRRPPLWAVAGLSVTLVVGLVTAAAWLTTSRVTAISTGQQPSTGAWIGRTSVGPLGAVLRDESFEFTVYRFTCPTDSERCRAVVGLHNVTERSQHWHGSLQRAYLPDGNWVSADEPATAEANEGQDMFAEPVRAGEHRIFPLVFADTGGGTPSRVELRSAVFSAGVSVPVT
jgi:hypothetical protein